MTQRDDGRNLICPECQSINHHGADFCGKCGYPFDWGMLDPIASMPSQRSALVRWVERPTRFTLAVMWLTHFPLFLVCAAMAVILFVNRKGLADFVMFWVSILLALLCAAFVYLTTRNFLQQRKARLSKRK